MNAEIGRIPTWITADTSAEIIDIAFVLLVFSAKIGLGDTLGFLQPTQVLI